MELMDDRHTTKQQELKILHEEYLKSSESFVAKPYAEDAAFLRQFGIIIPGKQKMQSVFLKLFASDFIVEEILIDKKICTINQGVTDLPPLPSEKGAIFATLVKCNVSTIEVVHELALKLGCEVKDIHYAGLKDKNAITSQRISIHNVPLQKLSGISSPYYFLKDIQTNKGGVQKGGLYGNRFTILLRTTEPINEVILKENMEKIKKEGFYNFYYLQRFGTPRLINYQWGFEILKGNYEKAVRGFLTSESDREILFFKKLRERIARDWPDMIKIQNILSPFPLICFNEQKVVRHLIKSPGDYLGALKNVPDQAMLWVYGFVSLLFNETLSSYATDDRVPPKEIPLLLSDNRDDIAFYERFLKAVKYWPPEFKNIRPFPHIRPQHRMIRTKDTVDFHSVKVIPEGVILSFSLEKGEYATTMLAHLFNLTSGSPAPELSKKRIDILSSIGLERNEFLLSLFEKIDVPGALCRSKGFDQSM